MSLALRIFSMWLKQTSIEFDANRCIVKRNKYVTCTKCQDACPIPDAIHLTKNNIDVDFNKCTDCKACTFSCPHFVFQDKQIYEQLEKAKHRKNIVFTCSNNSKNSNFIEYTCLRQLTFAHLLFAGLHGKEIGIVYHEEKCHQCAFHDPDLYSHLEKMIATANDFFQQKVDAPIFSIGEEYRVEDAVYSRNEFLKYIPQTIKKATKDFLPDWKENISVKDKLEKSNDALLTDFVLSKLAEKQALPMDMNIDLQLLGASKVKIADTCNGCGICIAHCPTQSLLMEKKETSVHISQHVLNCTDCTACQKTCPKQAIEYKYTSKIAELFSNIPIYTYHMKTCKECGALSAKDVCPQCQKKKRMEADIFAFFS